MDMENGGWRMEDGEVEDVIQTSEVFRGTAGNLRSLKLTPVSQELPSSSDKLPQPLHQLPIPLRPGQRNQLLQRLTFHVFTFHPSTTLRTGVPRFTLAIANAKDVRMRRDLLNLPLSDQLLVHLLPRPGVGVDDGDVHLGAQAAQADEAAGQVINADLLALWNRPLLQIWIGI